MPNPPGSAASEPLSPEDYSAPAKRKPRRLTSLVERYWRYVDRRDEHECWNWTGTLARSGYGVLGLGRREHGILLAHRAAYAIAGGVIPQGYEIDHLCRNRACVNPAHLEAVTKTVNLQRQAAANKAERAA